VTVPKYGMCILHFDGIDRHYNAPEIHTPIKYATGVKISVENPTLCPSNPNIASIITKNKGRLTLDATVEPADAFLQTAAWTILDNTSIAAYTVDGATSTTLYTTGKATGNGKIRVVAYVNDGSGVADTVSICIDGQAGIVNGNCCGTGSAVVNVNSDNSDIQLYPVPATDYLKVILPENLLGTVSIVNLNGGIIHSEAIKNSEINLDIRALKQGIYLVRLDLSTGPRMLKFVKQ
jgi:hypothetical protein